MLAGDDPDDADFDPEYGVAGVPPRDKVVLNKLLRSEAFN